jgi:hypothetical protein
MSIFKIAVAGALLFVIAPDETRSAVKSLMGFAQEAREQLPAAAAEQAMTYCKANPKECMEAAKQASNLSDAPPLKAVKR